MDTLKMTKPELEAFLIKDFPQVADIFRILDLAPMRLSVSMAPRFENLRPGGTVSGPAMFGLADVGVYLAVLAMVGPKALAVTTTCSIDFMRKPAADKALRADVTLLKLGRVLAVGDVRILVPEDGNSIVARATLTYSLPSG